MDVDAIARPAPRYPLRRGIVQTQPFSKEKHGLLVAYDTRRQLGGSTGLFDVPPFTAEHSHASDCERLFEETLTELEQCQKSKDYLSATVHYREVREILGKHFRLVNEY